MVPASYQPSGGPLDGSHASDSSRIHRQDVAYLRGTAQEEKEERRERCKTGEPTLSTVIPMQCSIQSRDRKREGNPRGVA